MFKKHFLHCSWHPANDNSLLQSRYFQQIQVEDKHLRTSHSRPFKAMFGIRRKSDTYHQEATSEEDSAALLPSKQAWHKSRVSRASLVLWVLVATAFAQAGVLGVQLWQWDRSPGVILPTNSLLATCKYRIYHYQVHGLTISQPTRRR